ncbi:uroporphyrinogen-III C-methyltransferase [Rodentibacter caecimuris]|uniref:HemX protein n=1 Tax=Rodentibacter caecimuris TaxID=1796644 RepID=A0ABX3KXA5_9PAST|nr:HemX protein [Rodentibacter heylii]
METVTKEAVDSTASTQESILKSDISDPPVIIKKSGTGLSLLAILIALGLGGVGYYFGQQKVNEIQQKLTALEQQIKHKAASEPTPTFDKNLLTSLENNLKTVNNKITQFEQIDAHREQSLTALQNRINQINVENKPQQPSDWLFSEADFLLNNALRKLVLDNDVETGVSLLKLADETLSKIDSPQAAEIRIALNQDLKQLLSVNSVDQNAVMQRLSQLANSIDELSVLNVNFNDEDEEKLSDSLADWKENAKKSANSFLNRFIRITPKDKSGNKELLAPNQDIYLRENIRLRLQLAIMAVPRQQSDLYKQSLEAVASWVRSYFDTSSDVTQNFLKAIDELSELSIYVDVPTQLHSLNVLDKLLNRPTQDLQKVEISADKAIADMPTANDASTNEENTDQTQPGAEKQIKAEQEKSATEAPVQ